MKFKELDVGDRFIIIARGNIAMVKTLPEYVSCCTLDSNSINLESEEKHLCPEETEVIKL